METAESQPTSEVDMSPDAIDRRLRNVSQLYKPGMAIHKARSKPVGTIEAPSGDDSTPRFASQVGQTGR
ncbi:MAG: hypothetical protein ABI614_22830 [Planctomycetota bacterium]